MRALYSLVCRLRTLYALGQGTITLAMDGWIAVTPGQLWVLGCGLWILARVLVPSPSGPNSPWAWMDRMLSTTAAAAIIGLTASEITVVCMFVGRLMLSL